MVVYLCTVDMLSSIKGKPSDMTFELYLKFVDTVVGAVHNECMCLYFIQYLQEIRTKCKYISPTKFIVVSLQRPLT